MKEEADDLSKNYIVKTCQKIIPVTCNSFIHLRYLLSKKIVRNIFLCCNLQYFICKDSKLMALLKKNYFELNDG